MVTWSGGNTIVDLVISHVDEDRLCRYHHGGREMVDFAIVGKGSFSVGSDWWMSFVSILNSSRTMCGKTDAC